MEFYVYLVLVPGETCQIFANPRCHFYRCVQERAYVSYLELFRRQPWHRIHPPMKLVAQLIEQQIGFLTFLTTDAKVMHRELVQTESGIKLFLIVNNKAEELSLVEVSAVPPNLIRCD